MKTDQASIASSGHEPAESAQARSPAAEGVHPNHLPDLRYARRTLERTRDLLLPKLHREDSAHGEVAAAINGLNYVIQRTEEAARATGAAA